MTSLSFEKALSDLEGIVQKLEKGGLSLNESLALFEKGVKLAKFLREELTKAEKKVEILLKDDKGEVRKEPFDLDREVGFSSKKEVEEGDEEAEDGDDEEDEEKETPF
ncbi:MAG: exodeoxyribonuclease VII small subunit [Candidatus Aminicenantes bacterium RBG_19FT_COMBO_59_29]|jgi:exodeoxyribonuclease VII small subunit|nr:MAG: exodeoxyribonuclease VII small subunit [Candidatus Aminicenantes bacterium RBG_19FT_COMBO_59_29]